MVSSGFFVEILAEAPAESVTPDPPNGVDIEVSIHDISIVSEMPGPEMVELQTPTIVRRDYEIGSAQPTDPAIMIWYRTS